MGYTTSFYGRFEITPPLNESEVEVLRKFSRERHDGPEFPGYYCQWEPTEDGTALVWDEGEKFYDSVEWMRYLIHRFMGEQHAVNGIVMAYGEEDGDIWRIVVDNNEVHEQRPIFVWPDGETTTGDEDW